MTKATMPKVTKRNLVLEGDNSGEVSDWLDLCNEIDYVMRDVNKGEFWRAEVQNFGWDKRSGYQYFKAENGETFLRAILPRTECSFKVYKKGKEILINNAHHDSPMWAEWYIIRPISEEEYNENV